MKWVAGLAALLVIVAVVGGAIAIKYGAVNLVRAGAGNSNNQSSSSGSQNAQSRSNEKAIPAEQSSVTPANAGSPSEISAASITVADLRGTWTGTYGPFSQPARIIIRNQKDKKFDGVLEQGSIRVAFSGSVDGSAVKMKQSAVISGGASSWALGEDVGTLSTSNKKMSGTGKDPVGGMVGMSYEWSFSRP